MARTTANGAAQIEGTVNKQLRVHLYVLTGFAVVLGLMMLFQIVSSATSKKGKSGGGTAGVESGHELVDAVDKAAAARSLGRRRNPESVPFLIPYLKYPDPEVRTAVAEALGQIGNKLASIDLIMRLENEPNTETMAAILRSLGQLGEESAIPKVVRRVDDERVPVRIAAVESLAHWSSTNAIRGIAHASSDTNAAVRQAAAAPLLRLGVQAIRPVLDVMREGPEESRVLRIETIAASPASHSVPALTEVLRDMASSYPLPQTPAMTTLINALVAKGNAAVAPAIEILAEPGNLPLKAAAATILARIKSDAGVEAARDRLLTWKAVSSRAEWRIWTDMVKAVDSPVARDAMAKLDAHYKTIAGQLPPVPPVPKRDPIPGRKATDSSGYTGELSIFLHRPDAPRKGINLDLELASDAGCWDRVFGCRSVNRGIHEGLVTDVKVTPDAFDLRLGVLAGDDPWVKGGFADLNVKLTRPGGGAGPLQGTYEGTYQGNPISGVVTGEERPRRPVFVRDYVPIHPDERPRLLFRQHELAAVRKRAQTPFGNAYQDACSRSADPLDHAMLYQITGDRNYAESSMKLVEKYGEEIEVLEGFGSGGFGHRIVRVVLCYDLCHDAWPESFKKAIRDRLRVTLPVMQNYIAITAANYDPCCNYYGPGRGAPAIAALALWGEKGPKPEPPSDPFSKPAVIEPARNYKPTEDTPVVNLAPGRMPERWLFAGPAPFPLAPMAEDSLFKISTLRPEPGTRRKIMGLVTETKGTNEVTSMAETEFAFMPLPADMLTNGVVNFASRCLPHGDSTFILSTVLNVETEQTVAFIPDGVTSLWIDGAKVDFNGCCRIKPGLHALSAVCTMTAERHTVAPRPVTPDSPEMKGKRAEHTFKMALWKENCDEWERLGGADSLWSQCLRKGFAHMYAHYRVGIGDGGFQAEVGSYADIASWYPMVYAGIYTRMFGRLPSPYPDVTHLVPRRMMQVYFPADGGTPSAVKLNSSHGLNSGHCAAMMPALPERFRAPVLWGWNRVAGKDGMESLAELRAGDLWRNSIDGAITFLNYPLDFEPVHPAKGMPLTWEARTFGYYCFRSGWEGKDEFISQVFLKAHKIGGWNNPNAGAFRIFGMGKGWVTGNFGKAGIRQFEPVVVLLPEWVEGTDKGGGEMKAEMREVRLGLKLADPKQKKPDPPKSTFSQGALSHLLHYKPEPDGSGVLSMDFKDVYSPAQKDPTIPRVTGMRSIGFDYSGKSGAPFLMGLADKIEGNVDKVWLWPLPDGCLANTTVKDNTFVVRQGDVTMKGTFLSPPNVRLEATSDSIVHLGAKLFDRTLDRIKAKGDGSFLVVITIQRGDTPAVAMQGAGMNARATIGKQTVRFDGQKIAFEAVP